MAIVRVTHIVQVGQDILGDKGPHLFAKICACHLGLDGRLGSVIYQLKVAELERMEHAVIAAGIDHASAFIVHRGCCRVCIDKVIVRIALVGAIGLIVLVQLQSKLTQQKS